MTAYRTSVLVTGSRGFIGRNLLEALHRSADFIVRTFDRDDPPGQLESALSRADFVFHLAGVNRPNDEREFDRVNRGLTEQIVSLSEKMQRRPVIVFASSIQALLDTSYGRSKKAAEDVLLAFSRRTGSPVYIYRLPGVFGKWSRPYYNSVVATFCHNIARGIEIQISDRTKEIELLYIDDLIEEFLSILTSHVVPPDPFRPLRKTVRLTLGELAEKIYELRDMRKTSIVPDMADAFTRNLYATYLSFLDASDFSYPVTVRRDERGILFELLKSPHFGQIFISTTREHHTRGNHYHNSKVEKFCVLKGKAVIKFRKVLSGEIISHFVSDERIVVFDIPPGYTHAIENVSSEDLIVLFWANQQFQAESPDTYYEEV